jgi:hypothetical protein
MLLYTLPLVGVFVAAFLDPTNAAMTYTALGMALGPQVLIYGTILLFCCSACCTCLRKPLEIIVKGLYKTYSKIMQPKK